MLPVRTQIYISAAFWPNRVKNLISVHEHLQFGIYIQMNYFFSPLTGCGCIKISCFQAVNKALLQYTLSWLPSCLKRKYKHISILHTTPILERKARTNTKMMLKGKICLFYFFNLGLLFLYLQMTAVHYIVSVDHSDTFAVKEHTLTAEDTPTETVFFFFPSLRKQKGSDSAAPHC